MLAVFLAIIPGMNPPAPIKSFGSHYAQGLLRTNGYCTVQFSTPLRCHLLSGILSAEMALASDVVLGPRGYQVGFVVHCMMTA